MAVEKKMLPSLRELRKQGAKIFVSYRNQTDSEVDRIHKKAIRSLRAEGLSGPHPKNDEVMQALPASAT